MSARVPEGAQSYKRTLTFTESTVPAGLLQDHSTKQGVWGLIHVEEGFLRYIVIESPRPPKEKILTADGPHGVVEPTVAHRVELLGPVRFYVEFLRRV